jgi:hypothetical protein
MKPAAPVTSILGLVLMPIRPVSMSSYAKCLSNPIAHAAIPKCIRRGMAQDCGMDLRKWPFRDQTFRNSQVQQRHQPVILNHGAASFPSSYLYR